MLALLLAAALATAPESLATQPKRFATNPLITPASDPSLGDNINGPSVIRVPSWIPNPLGRYYLYFAHHHGRHIRLAYADALTGPWKIHAPGVFQLSQLAGSVFGGHVASPDVHVDSANRRVLLYFHAAVGAEQKTGLALSPDGLRFVPMPGVRLAPYPDVLGNFYFRVFRHGGAHYAVAKNGNVGGEILRSPDGNSPFGKGADILPMMRHAAVLLRGDRLLLFHSLAGDAPERILVSTVDLRGDWKAWTPSAATEVIRPTYPYEGSHLPVRPSGWGAEPDPVHQLRDPGIFEEDGRVFLFYSIAGEQGIAGAELEGLRNVPSGIVTLGRKGTEKGRSWDRPLRRNLQGRVIPPSRCSRN